MSALALPIDARPAPRDLATPPRADAHHLEWLESEAIHILREVAGQCANPALLFSGGKDSLVLLRLAEKAFRPGPFPFPLLHVDTGHNFPEVLEFRDARSAELGERLIVRSVEDSIAQGRVVLKAANESRNPHQSITLLDAIAEFGFDACIGGARRDEEKARAKERIFSFRDPFGQWDPKNQRPELWNLYNARVHAGEHVRVFPISNWTELDVWQYIASERLAVPSIYLAHVRPVVRRRCAARGRAPRHRSPDAPACNARASPRHSAPGGCREQDGPRRLAAGAVRCHRRSISRVREAHWHRDVAFVPMSATLGDMVVDRGDNLDWYAGPTLLQILETVEVEQTLDLAPLRFPVQYVARPTADVPRRYLGRIESGSLAVGDEVFVLPSGRRTRICDIQTYDGALSRAGLHASVGLVLDDEVDVSRGDMIVKAGELPRASSRLTADLCWLGDASLDPARTYVIRHTTREVRARVERIEWRWDVTTQDRELGGRSLSANDIARVRLLLAQPVFADPYAEQRATGSFVLIDEATNDSIAAGMVVG